MTRETKHEKYPETDLFERGFALFQSGQYAQAADYFRLLTLVAPSEGDYYAAMGHALKKSADNEGALAAYQTAVLLGHDKEPDLMFSMAETLNSLTYKKEALAALKQAIRHAEPSFKARLKMIQKVWKTS